MTLRAEIRDEVARIAPLDLAEAQDQAGVLAWIDSGAGLCRLRKPATPDPHLVSYFAVIDGDHLLLVDHIHAGLWLPPGGHVEPGEHPRDTVRREAQEELGVAAEFLLPGPLFLTVTRTVGATPGHRDVSLWYLLAGRRDRKLAWDRGEFHGLRWFAPDELPFERSAPDLGRFLAKLRERRLI